MSSEEQNESGFFTRKRIIIISVILFVIVILIFILHIWSGYWLLFIYYNYPSCEGVCETIHEYTPVWFTGNGILHYIECQTPTTGYENQDSFRYIEVEPRFGWLGEKGSGAIPFIVKGLKTKHLYLRLVMFYQIFYMSWFPDMLSNEDYIIELKNEVLKRLKDRHPSVRLMAFNALSCVGMSDEEVLEIAEKLKDDKDENVAQYVKDYIDEINGINSESEPGSVECFKKPKKEEETPGLTPEGKRKRTERAQEMIRELEKRMNE